MKQSKPLPNFTNVQYGQLVQLKRPDGYHSGVKIHFFNQRGVFVGNFYEFVPYSEINFRDNNFKNDFEKVFYNDSWETLKQFFYEKFCKVATFCIRKTQKWSA